MILIVLLASPALHAQEEKPDSLDQQAMMAQYMKLAEPGDEHELLATYVGEWKLSSKYWAKPGAEPINDTGSAVNEMILGGRFLKTKATSGSGMSRMESMSIMGFDQRYDEFTVVGFDTWGTYFVTAAGNRNESGAIIMSGEDADPVFGFKQVYDIVFRPVSKDEYITEVIFKNKELTGGADSFKMVEITYRREK